MADPAEAAAPKAPLPEWLEGVVVQPEYAWAITQWRRAEAHPGAWFDAAKAAKALELWPVFFRLTEDRFAGVPFRPNIWQAIVIRLVVGWKVPTEVTDPNTGATIVEHVRLYRELRLWIPRKNGKSEFLAAAGLFFWILDGVYRGQGFVFARDEEQAKIVLDKMKEMIALGDQLRSKVTAFAKALYIPANKSSFVLLTGTDEGKHGKSPTVIVGDEMHEWRSLEVKTTLRQGTGARLQPIGLYASTAGLKDRVIGYGQWEESRAILDGRIANPRILIVIFAADPDDDWQSEAVWRKANPSLGLSPTLDFLRDEASLAVDNPRAEAHFRRYHLNQWVDGEVRWINVKRWDQGVRAKDWRTRRERLAGRKAFGAFDVSSTQDITAWVVVFPPEPVQGIEHWDMICRFWVPEDTLARRIRANPNIRYEAWTTPDANGVRALDTTPGDYVDQNFVKKAVLEDFDAFDIQLVGYDPWNARKLVADLEAEGVAHDQLVEMRQGIQTLGEPSKEFERLIYAGLFDHGGHPVMRWMIGNAVVRFDENMNYAPAKKRSGEKIDGVVAGVMATGLAIYGEALMVQTGSDVVVVV